MHDMSGVYVRYGTIGPVVRVDDQSRNAHSRPVGSSEAQQLLFRWATEQGFRAALTAREGNQSGTPSRLPWA